MAGRGGDESDWAGEMLRVAPDRVVEFGVPERYHLGRSLSTNRMGVYDPTLRLAATTAEWAIRTPQGPSAIRAVRAENAVCVAAWGGGAAWITERAAELLGLRDAPGRFDPQHERVRRLWRRYPGMHLPRLPRVFDRLIQVTMLQLIPWREAVRAWQGVVRAMGETAPGPLDLRLPPAAAVLADTPYFRLVAHGLTPRQARTIRQLARRVDRIEQAAEGGAGCLAQTLGAVPGIGPWTVQFMLGSAMGEPDAVLEGDYNLPHTVSWALAGEPRGSDARMLELLESYRGHRYRVTRLLWISGARAPRSGSRRALRGRVSAPGAHAKKR